jgi:aminopeptidase N
MHKYIILCLAALLATENSFAQRRKKKDKEEEKKEKVEQQDMLTINADTLVVTPRTNAPEPKVYQGTNPRSADILHTKLEVKFDWNNSWMYGKATIDIKPYFYPMKKLYLNARGMDLYKVQIVGVKGNADLKYVYENDSIKIELDKEYTRNDKFTVFIDYKSKPNELKAGGSSAISSDKGLYFVNPKGEEKNKMPQIWTQGETQSNSAWFPTVDSPNERMTNEILMTVDDKYTTLSNGLLVKQTKNTDGTRVDHWKMDMPHAPYLVMMGVGEFKKVLDKPWNGKEISYYVEKEYEPHARAIFGNTPEMVDFFSKKLGVPFAWPKYAQIVVRDYVSGAMENTSATLHGDFSVYQTEREIIDGKRGENVISHELFHQWFGDLVTCESWSNITVNESFATYGEYLWQEYKNGADAADAHGYNSRQGYMAQSKMEPLVRFGYHQREEVFDAISYNKGGQILHMLRKYVGDDAFFASLKLYLETNKFKSAEAHNLRLAFEEVTGQDLNWFFNQWYYAGGYPELKIDYSYDAAARQVKVKVEQQQDFTRVPLYRLPLFIDIYYGEGATRKVRREWVTITKAMHEFSFSSDEKPMLVNFDGEKQLLGTKTDNKSPEDYVYQYKNAPKYVDRLEALDKFKSNLDNPAVYACVKLALKDRWHGLRIKAINLLEDVAAKQEAEVKPLLVAVAKTDEKTTVRAEAIDFLAKNYKGDEVKEIYMSALNEQSYAILGSGLAALAKNDPQAAMKKAKDLENVDSDNIRFTLMDLYANYGDDSNHEYFVKSKDSFSGFMAMGFINMYGQFLKRCSDSNVLAGAELIKGYTAKGKGNSYVRYVAQKVLKDFYNNYQDKEDELVSKKDDASAKRLTEVTATKNKLKAILDEAKQ